MYEKEVLLIYLRDPSNREYYVYIQVTTLSPKALYIHIYIYFASELLLDMYMASIHHVYRTRTHTIEK